MVWCVDSQTKKLGAVVRFAAKAGVPIPVVSTLYSTLLLQERRARAQYAAALAASTLTVSSRASTPEKVAEDLRQPARRSSMDSWGRGTFEEQQEERHRRLEADFRRQSQESRRQSIEENHLRRQSADRVNDWFQRGLKGKGGR